MTSTQSQTEAGTAMTRVVPTLPMSDVERAVEYYVDRLGFTRIAARRGYGRVGRDGVELHFWHCAGDVRGAEAYLAGTGRCRVVVDDVSALAEELRERGVDFSSDRAGTELYVRDQDGNRLTFA